ncbi:MAG: BspA family leucine-rich repeat surface protein, partial [Candidatus Lactobacillus pullistercoris]|nr:BspA family leucine-rich repeat surface protein [Candidatus Lactobacillus pullistercoris]
MFNLNEKQRFSLRKLSVGLASVCIGLSFVNMTSKEVKADTVSAQTSVAETKTSKNNKVDANADASKEVAKFTNSVDSNKITPSQTVLNKQATSNDVLKGTDAKQEQVAESAQNSVADQSQKNLLDDLGKQKASTQSGDQAEVKNQENRLVDQINYKLINQDNTDNNQNLGQNKVAPDETKQAPTTKSDAEKNIVGSSSIQQTNNQSNNHAEDNSQSQNEPKLDLTKNSQLAKKVLATNLIETNSSSMTNGGFDEATWGKLDVTKWQGSVQDGFYLLTNYTGDSSHIIVPNEADFEQAGKSTNGLQVGITRDTVQSLSSNQTQTIAFSKTNNQKVKAIGTDWSSVFSSTALSKFDGSNLDVSSITDMSDMFDNNKVSDLTSLANWNTSKVTNMSSMFQNSSISDFTPLTNWDTSKVTDMNSMFQNSSISDLTPLANWNTSKVTDMDSMFMANKISNLAPLAHWDTSKVTDMSCMFQDSSISDLTPLTHWDTSKVTDMRTMFMNNPDIIDLRPIANWNISSITNNLFNGFSGLAGLFASDTKLNLTNINNTPLMQGFLKEHDALAMATFITNNADLVKAITGKDLPNLTNTAKRTITFNIPHATPKTIVQTINYKAIAPVQVNFDLESPQIVQTYPVKESDWQLDDSKQNDDVIIDGVICFKPIKIPHVNGYKAHLIKDPVNPTAFLVSFMAVPEQPQKNQLTSNNDQSSQKPVQTEQNQPEPIQTKPADDKQVDQLVRTISYTLMHNDSSNTADSFEPAQTDSAPLETADVTQKVTPKPAKPTSIET